MITEMNGRGDTKKIFEVVNALKGKSEKPPSNLTTNGQGSLLCIAEEVTDRWLRFLSKKFEPTTAETTTRLPMPTLPNTQGVDDLTIDEIKRGISKMKANKATGPDEIPVEVFKSSPTCMSLLTSLILKI